ncbi:MAG: Gfo/Idh/MocA family oxidoreductase, partial [Rhodoglobus sp.]|nr:Gfo/Idh/MocA family oxidoreductase [Rhodoglobus sp.]
LGIVGAGVMGVKVAAAAERIDGVTVTAVADADLGRAERLAAEYGARGCLNLAELVALDAVDAVYIALPHDLHVAACLESAAAGLHVLIDKPMCNTAEEARAIIEARDAAGIQLMVGFSYRYRAEWNRARELIASGALGTIRLVVDTLIESGAATPAWYWNSASGGGVIQLQTHHCFDRLAWLCDDSFVSVSCLAAGTEGSAENSAVINAKTSSGILTSLAVGFERGYSAAARPATVIQGDRGHLVIDHDRTLWFDAGDQSSREDFSNDDWLLAEIEGFAEMCAGETGAPTAEDGRTALACALAAAESARHDGIPVRVE